MRYIDQYDYNNKRVFLRVDLNVPVSNGRILDDTRINKIIPTIKYLLDRNAKVIIASHFGRPKGEFDSKYSLEFISAELSRKIGKPVAFIKSISESFPSAEIVLLENLRFYPGEAKNDAEFASQLASLADFYINDAFSCCHRAHASIVKIAEILPSAAGLLLQREIENLTAYLSSPQKPIMAIIGGSKVSTKLELLYSLIKQVDYLVIGGAMANTFLKCQNIAIGKSLYEEDLLNKASDILANAGSCKIILPQDVVVATEIAENASNCIVDIKNIPQDHLILDIGPATCGQINQILHSCKTVILNGPVGVFEYFPFSVGTVSIAREVAKLTKANQLISIAGGGDIVAALSKAGLFEQFSYISTAGGAFLEWLEGKSLPGLEALN